MTPKKPTGTAPKRKRTTKKRREATPFHSKSLAQPTPPAPPTVAALLEEDPSFRQAWERLPLAQQAFVLALPDCNWNATEAYTRAYPESKRTTAHVNSVWLMRRPEVAVCVKAICEGWLQAIGISSERILQEVARLAFVSMTDVATWDEDGVHFIPSAQLDPAAAAAIKSIKSKRRTVKDKDGNVTVTVEQEVTLHPKLEALEKLGDYKKLFAKQIETKGILGIVMVLQGLPRGEIDRLNALPDEELRQEIARISAGK